MFDNAALNLKKEIKYLPDNSCLANRLIYEGYRFSFTRAIDVSLVLNDIDLANISYNDLNIIAVSGKLNFQSKYSDIHAVEGIIDDAPEIVVNTNNFCGIDGILPDLYVEDYVLYNRQTKNAVTGFFDIFNHHFSILKYLFCKKQVVSCLSTSIEHSIFGKIISSMAGFPFEEAQEDARDIPDLIFRQQFRISTQNLFWRWTRSADSLKIAIASFFKVDVDVEQFVGGFTTPVPFSELTRIGTRYSNYNNLGQNTILGEKIWDSMMGLRIHIKSLKIKQYIDFLPKPSTKDRPFSKLEKLKKIVKMYVPIGMKVQLMFHLQDEQMVNSHLGGVNRLNKDMFLGQTDVNHKVCFTEHI